MPALTVSLAVVTAAMLAAHPVPAPSHPVVAPRAVAEPCVIVLPVDPAAAAQLPELIRELLAALAEFVGVDADGSRSSPAGGDAPTCPAPTGGSGDTDPDRPSRTTPEADQAPGERRGDPTPDPDREPSPSSNDPSSNDPSSNDPSSNDPSSNDPSSDAPRSDSPSGGAPNTPSSADEPGADKPGADKPGADEAAADKASTGDSGADDSGNKDSGNKDSGNKDSGNKDSGNKDSEGKDSEGKDSEGKDSEGKDSEGKDSEGKDSDGKDSGAEGSGGKESGAAESSSDESSSDESSSDESSSGEADADDSGAGDSSTGDSGGKDSGTKDSGTDDSSGTDSSDRSDDSDVDKPDAAESSGGSSDGEKSDGEKSDGEKPDGEKPDGEKGTVEAGSTGDGPAPAAAASGGDAQMPADLLALENWFLTLPVGPAGDPDSIDQPELLSYTSEYFQLTPDRDGVVFRAPAGGVTTKNSKYPRSELREMNGADEKAAWSNTSGTHILETRQAITEVPPAKPEVVSAQIHDGGDDVMQIRLEGQTLVAQYADGKEQIVIDPAYVLGTPYDLRIEAADGRVTVFYNGERSAEIARSGTSWYWKIGAYIQSNPEQGDAADAAGEVVVYSLSIEHTP